MSSEPSWVSGCFIASNGHQCHSEERMEWAAVQTPAHQMQEVSAAGEHLHLCSSGQA